MKKFRNIYEYVSYRHKLIDLMSELKLVREKWGDYMDEDMLDLITKLEERIKRHLMQELAGRSSDE